MNHPARFALGRRLSGWRRIADAMWRPPDDPQIFGAIDIDATELRAAIDRLRRDGHHVTPTHFVGRAVGLALREVPDLNARIVGGRLVPRSTIDVFFITAVQSGEDLSGVKIVRADEKPVVEVARELQERSAAMKAGRDPDLARSKRAMARLPFPLLKLALRATAFAAGDLDVSLPALGLTASPFGSAMVTSVGMFGLPTGFAPLAWMYKVPLLVLAGEIGDRPVVVEGRVEVRPIMPITATIDHRYVDGWHISRLMKPFREYLEHPMRFEP